MGTGVGIQNRQIPETSLCERTAQENNDEGYRSRGTEAPPHSGNANIHTPHYTALGSAQYQGQVMADGLEPGW